MFPADLPPIVEFMAEAWLDTALNSKPTHALLEWVQGQPIENVPRLIEQMTADAESLLNVAKFGRTVSDDATAIGFRLAAAELGRRRLGD